MRAPLTGRPSFGTLLLVCGLLAAGRAAGAVPEGGDADGLPSGPVPGHFIVTFRNDRVESSADGLAR